MNIHYLISFLLLFSGFGGAVSASDQSPVIVSEKLRTTNKDHILFLEDEERTYNVGEVWDMLKNDQFSQWEGAVFARPTSRSSYWFAFSAQSQLNVDLWVNVNNSNLDSLHLYKLDTEGKILDEYLSGAYLPYETRPYNAKTFWFPVIEPNDTAEYVILFKVYSGAMMEVPVQLGSFSALSEYRMKKEFYSVFFIGAMILMFLYNVFNFIYTRDKIYAYYSLYILFITLSTTLFNNYPIVEKIFGLYFSHYYAMVWLSPGFIFIGLFSMNYLDLKSNFLLAYRLIQIEILVLSLVSLMNLFVPLPYLANLFQFTVIIFVFTCLLSGYYCWFKLKMNTVLYSIGWTSMMIASFIYLLTVNGFIEYNLYLRNCMYGGIMLEVIMFSIALAKRINSLKLEQVLLNKKLRQKNEELVFINESLDAFNYHVSHDLKTVLSNANSMALLAKKYNLKKNHEKLDEVIKRLMAITTNGMDTVQSFLTLGSLESSITSDEFVEMNLEEEVFKILELNDLKDEIKVDIIHNEIESININAKVLESIFLNFFTNTIKYNENFPAAQISFYKDELEYKFVYSDNGIGIDLEKSGHKLFQPFTRIKNKSNAKGTGLGLYLMKRMINSFEGRIEVESEVGKGTTFTIYLPKESMVAKETTQDND